jgi:acyl dehydratase
MSAPALPAPGDRLPEATIGPFDAEALQRYADVSGDDNPLHLDDDLAKMIGLAAPPVHGMKLFAFFESYLADWRPDLAVASISGKFVQPVLRGETAKLSGRVLRASPEDGVFVRLFAHGSARVPAIIGEATLRMRSGAGA